jgi:hypothetical protein
VTIAQPTQRRVPVWALAISGVAGVLIIAHSLYWLFLGSVWNDPSVAALYSVVASGVVFGLVMLYSTYRLRSTPGQKMTWGAIIMLFSLFGLVTVGGGFVIGSILGIIGGGLAVAMGQEGR